MADVVLSRHAIEALRLRGISAQSVESVLAAPEWEAPDPVRPGVVRAFGRTPETGNRWVRVAYRRLRDDVIFVITVLPDRDANPLETP